MQRAHHVGVVAVGAGRVPVAELARVGELGPRAGLERLGVEAQPLAVELVGADAAEVARDARELRAQPGGVEPDRLDQLGAAVGRGRRHAHHRHRLDEAAAQALEVRLLALARAQAAEPGAERVGAHRDEQRRVVDVPHRGVGHDPDAVPQAHLDERVVQAARRAQHRHRGARAVDAAVGEHDHGGAPGEVEAARDHVVERRLEPLRRRASRRTAARAARRPRASRAPRARPSTGCARGSM